VSLARFTILSAATAKAVTPKTPSLQSKTWRQIRQFMESFNLEHWTRIGAVNRWDEVGRVTPCAPYFAL
jgi:hypothetical protein